MNPIIIIALIVLTLLGGVYLWNQFSQCSFQEQNKNIKTKHEQRKTKYRRRLQDLHIEEQKENYRGNKLAYHTRLYELYYVGIPDRYDNNGNKIKGIEPNAQQVVKHLRKIIEYSPILQKGSARLKLAKLYHLGMHKFKPQLKVAKKMYAYMIVSRGLTDEVYVQTEELLKRINKDIYEDYVNQYRLRRTRGARVLPPKKEAGIVRTLNKDQRKKNANPPVWKNHTVNRCNNRNPVQVVETLRRLEPVLPPEIPLPPVQRDNERVNDPQNAHNSQVLSTVIHSINNLKKSTKIEKSLPTSLKEVRSFLNNLPENDKRNDALKSLNRIERNTLRFTFSDMKEVDVLNLIWNRIHSDVHADNLETVKESLFNQLADMQEHGVIVCATGRFTRLVDTLNVIDNEVTIKPSYVINQEMMNKSSKIRENMLNTYSENERKELEKGISYKQEQFDQNLKEEIVGILKEDYVKTKILSQEKFDHQINQWIDDI